MYRSKYATDKFNIPFYKLRKTHGYSQTELGAALGGYHKQTVSKVEAGIAAGKLDFWQAVQKLYKIPDEDMWALINGIEAPKNTMI